MVWRPQTKSYPQGPLPGRQLNHMDRQWSPAGHRLSDRVRKGRFTAVQEGRPRGHSVLLLPPSIGFYRVHGCLGGKGGGGNDGSGERRKAPGLGTSSAFRLLGLDFCPQITICLLFRPRSQPSSAQHRTECSDSSNP